MKKLLPFVLPGIVILIIAFLGYRWYQDNTSEQLTPPEVTAGQEIEELSAAERAALENLQKGLGNYQTVTMTGTGMGEIRYEIRGEKVLFSVNANLPTDAGQIYHLYTKEAGASDFIQGSVLIENKGGLSASMGIGTDKLPFEVQVRLGAQVVLNGVIQAEN